MANKPKHSCRSGEKVLVMIHFQCVSKDTVKGPGYIQLHDLGLHAWQEARLCCSMLWPDILISLSLLP